MLDFSTLTELSDWMIYFNRLKKAEAALTQCSDAFVRLPIFVAQVTPIELQLPVNKLLTLIQDEKQRAFDALKVHVDPTTIPPDIGKP
jgi:hypothetical protein